MGETRAVGRGHMQRVAWRSSGDRRGHLLTRGAALPAVEVTCAGSRHAGGCAMGAERAKGPPAPHAPHPREGTRVPSLQPAPPP